jgi:hypothetical protein
VKAQRKRVKDREPRYEAPAVEDLGQIHEVADRTGWATSGGEASERGALSTGDIAGARSA